jgi:hypothetical protein
MMKIIWALPLTAFLLTYPAAAEKIWEDSYIELTGGGSIWARVDSESGCPYKLLVGSSTTNISGGGANCSENPDGIWALNACGKIDNLFRGSVEDVINEIIRLCN